MNALNQCKNGLCLLNVSAFSTMYSVYSFYYGWLVNMICVNKKLFSFFSEKNLHTFPDTYDSFFCSESLVGEKKQFSLGAPTPNCFFPPPQNDEANFFSPSLGRHFEYFLFCWEINGTILYHVCELFGSYTRYIVWFLLAGNIVALGMPNSEDAIVRSNNLHWVLGPTTYLGLLVWYWL